jgi:hypothetical protein
MEVLLAGFARWLSHRRLLLSAAFFASTLTSFAAAPPVAAEIPCMFDAVVRQDAEYGHVINVWADGFSMRTNPHADVTLTFSHDVARLDDSEPGRVFIGRKDETGFISELVRPVPPAPTTLTVTAAVAGGCRLEATVDLPSLPDTATTRPAAGVWAVVVGTLLLLVGLVLRSRAREIK